MLTNKEIFDLYEGLYAISQKPEISLTIKASYFFAKNKHILEPIYNAITENRRKVLEQYGSYKEDGSWYVTNELVEKFNSEWDHLMAIENDIEVDKVDLNDLKDSGINMELMEKLLPIIEI